MHRFLKPSPPADMAADQDKDKSKEITTGSIPRAAPPQAPPCVPERDPGDITGTLSFHQDPQAGFAQLYRGRRVCSPGWTLTVAALPQKLDDGTWRVWLSSGFAGVWVVMDTRSDISFLRPEQRVRVEGTVLNFLAATLCQGCWRPRWKWSYCEAVMATTEHSLFQIRC